MKLVDYYSILDIPANSPVDEIKKAYRKKARLYHPDINHSPEAVDHFIGITEAYEFLLAYHEKIKADSAAYDQAMEDWRKYRQDRSRQRARAYARASYVTFKNSKIYKSTRILNGTTIIFSFMTSIMVLTYTVAGYIYRLRHPVPGLEPPSVFAFLMLLVLGSIFFVVSMIYLIAYIETSGKHRKKTHTA